MKKNPTDMQGTVVVESLKPSKSEQNKIKQVDDIATLTTKSTDNTKSIIPWTFKQKDTRDDSSDRKISYEWKVCWPKTCKNWLKEK